MSLPILQLKKKKKKKGHGWVKGAKSVPNVSCVWHGMVAQMKRQCFLDYNSVEHQFTNRVDHLTDS